MLLMLNGMNITDLFLSKQHNCTKAIENWNYAMKLDSTKANLQEEINNCGK